MQKKNISLNPHFHFQFAHTYIMYFQSFKKSLVSNTYVSNKKNMFERIQRFTVSHKMQKLHNIILQTWSITHNQQNHRHLFLGFYAWLVHWKLLWIDSCMHNKWSNSFNDSIFQHKAYEQKLYNCLMLPKNPLRCVPP